MKLLPENDVLPDVRDGLTREERVVLYVLHETQKERGGRNVPTAMLWGRVCEHFYISPEELSAMLARLGVRKGDRVGIFLPLLPETVITVLALGKLQAIYIPIFSGYAAPAVASRLNDAGATLLVTADGTYRRGGKVLMKKTADEALAQTPTVKHLLVVGRDGRP